MKTLARVKRRVRRFALRNYKLVAPFLPNRYRAYQTPGGRIYLNIKESKSVMRRAFGVYEPNKQHALRHFLRPGMIFVDVGANLGDFSLMAARVMGDQGRVLAVEPEKTNVEWMGKSIELNGYRSIKVFPLALSDHEGEGQLLLHAKGARHTLKDWDWHKTEDTVAVPLRTLDGLLADEGATEPDVIKIDVEGGEMDVLKGAETTLAGSRPLVLLLDLHPPLIDSVELCLWLQDRGFELHEPAPPFGPLAEVHPKLREAIAVRS